MRQTTTGNKTKKKICSQCGATTWLKNQTTGEFSGPWHFLDCPSVPGGRELSLGNIDEKARWVEEKRVPREQGARILEAIKLMLSTPKTADGKPSKVFYERKAAILEEGDKL